MKVYRPQGIRQWGGLKKVEVLVYINLESHQLKVPYTLQIMVMMMMMTTVTILLFTQIFGMDQPEVWAAVQGWTVVQDQTVPDVVANPVV
jgi:hypothetical protein